MNAGRVPEDMRIADRLARVHHALLEVSQSLLRRLRGAHPPGQRRPAYYHVDRVTPWLLVGPALHVRDYALLAREGVTHVLDLREEAGDDIAALQRLGIEYRRLAVENEAPPTEAQFDETLQWLRDEVLARGGVLYLHCQGGMGRAPSCSMAFLVDRGYSLNEAHRLVLAARPEASPSEAQMAWLEGFERRRSSAAVHVAQERETR